MPQNRIASINYRKRKRDKKDELEKQVQHYLMSNTKLKNENAQLEMMLITAKKKKRLGEIIAGDMDKKLPAAGGNTQFTPGTTTQALTLQDGLNQLQKHAPYQNQVTHAAQAAMNYQNNMSLLSASSAAAATLGNQLSHPTLSNQILSNQAILAAVAASQTPEEATPTPSLCNHQNAPLFAAALPSAANTPSSIGDWSVLNRIWAPNLMRACSALSDGGAANNRTENKDGFFTWKTKMDSLMSATANVNHDLPSSITTNHTQDRDGAARHVAMTSLAAAHSASLRDSTTVTSRPTIIVPNAATPVYLPTSSSCPPFAAAYHNVSSGPQVDSIVDEIERLQKFRMNGILTEEEFQAAKKKLLGL